MQIRIKGIDTPEMRGKCEQEKVLARKGKQRTVELLRGTKIIELRELKRGKYFRIVAEVFVDDDSVGQVLLREGFAIEYDGGKRVKDWCE